MNYGKKLANVVRARNRTEMEQPLLIAQIDTLILHRTRVTTASGIHSNSVEIDDSFQLIVIHVLVPLLFLPLKGVGGSYILSGTSMPKRPMPFFTT